MPETLVLAVLMIRVPPSGMASRALIERLRIASSSWVESANTQQLSPLKSVRSRIEGPSVRSSRSIMLVMSGSTSTGFSSRRCTREKASNWLVSRVPRSSACIALPAQRSTRVRSPGW